MTRRLVADLHALLRQLFLHVVERGALEVDFGSALACVTTRTSFGTPEHVIVFWNVPGGTLSRTDHSSPSTDQLRSSGTSKPVSPKGWTPPDSSIRNSRTPAPG